MLVKKKELKNIIREVRELIKEGHGGPCPISTANQLHAAGASEADLQSFVNTLVDQFMKNKASANRHVSTPNRTGLIRGFGF